MTTTTDRAVISDEYRALQQDLHRRTNYGVASLQFGKLIKSLLEKFGAQSVSDYGAGRKNLLVALEREGVSTDYRPYDPAFPEYGEPTEGDLVCCIDVLEHIEPDLLDNVLDDLQRITVKHGFFTVHTGPAMKILADGRNAHIIQQPREWWLPQLTRRFNVVQVADAPGGFMVLVSRLPA